MTVSQQVKYQSKAHQENRAELKCFTNLLVVHHKINDKFWSKSQMLFSNKSDLVRGEILLYSSCAQAKPFLWTVYSA